ncbi:alanine racemase [Acidithiobacillus sp.]|jgi:alanine racemase|uniref:alanine racemase n=1 Tax=Acidithiobacillus sp. TaxID=1872118 RepID=UPI0025C013F8|nr:alanine racemase [Acidithiobacillus sp.]MCK9189295.1 alanine racemase [Acidithiobacillus sp.]MCK9359385.1 alanine racemase [Acidithiobacillus sp.]
MTRPVVAHISAAALRHNMAVVRQHAPHAQIMAAVKANAYGHDVALCAPVLAEAGVDAFAVASLDEAETLHDLRLEQPVCLLGGPFDAEEIAVAAARGYLLVIHEQRQLLWLAAHAADASLRLFIKVDTGMHRLGFAPDQLSAVFAGLQSHPRWRVLGLMSHLARSDTPDDPLSRQQADVFAEAVAHFGHCTAGQHTLANSGGVLALPFTHQHWVRPGLMLYGLSPFAGHSGTEIGLQPVLSWRSAVVAIRELAPGDWLGYGAAWQAPAHCRVGVVAAGYGDGYPRHLGSGAPVTVAGQATRTLARVSMDMLFVDLTTVSAEIGASVVLMGAGGPALESLAARLDTISYELSCRMQMRVPRQLVS